MENQESTAATAFIDVKQDEPASAFATNATENRRMNMQNVLLIWLDNNINENNADCTNTIKQFKRVVNNVNTFTDGEQCVEFIQTITNNKVCMIVSDSLGQHIVPNVHDMSQVDTILVFCNNQASHEQWTKEWPKIKGVFTDISAICEALKQAAHQCEQNATSISFVASKNKFDQLDSTFIYTQILKEILLTINFDDEHFKEFIAYCREVYEDDENELKNVNQLQITYKDNTAIWWYTKNAFLYSMLNQALRLMDVDMIIRMGFFINDLHRDIQRLHSEQFDGEPSGKIFTVYRGQGLSKEDFSNMTKAKGGLISFNNFLSTGKTRDMSLKFARQAATNPDLIGVLFIMSIDPAETTTPFASIGGVSYFHTEDEVLFSMHTMFSIEDIKPIDENNHLYQVNLTLTNDSDHDLLTLTDRIRQDTFPGSNGWYRLGQLLIKMGHFTKAQEVYEELVRQSNDESENASVYHQLGGIKNNEGEYEEALSYYEKALAIYQETLPANDINLDNIYNDMGVLYHSMGDYLKGLSFDKKVLEIKQQSLPSNHPDLATSYNNMGNAYSKMGDYPKSLSYYEKAFEIRQQSLPPNHPDFGASYSNLGMVYESMGDYSKSLSYYEKALEIRLQSLPPNHPELGDSYNNLGTVCDSMGDYSKALSYYEKALAITQQSLPPSHPSLGSTYNNIGMAYKNMSDYRKALSSHEKALEIQQKSLPPNHPELGTSYDNIGMVYYSMDDYTKALSYFEKAHAIRQQSLPSNHPEVGVSYNSLGMVYDSMGDYPKALSYYEKALEIQRKSLPSNHPDFGASYNNLGMVYDSMGDYPEALSYYEKALTIKQQSLPSNHPSLGNTYNNLGMVYENMGNYSKAHSCYKCALEIVEQSLPTNPLKFQKFGENLERVKQKL
ncbi:unnamed protein product [Adineta steineri]|uniref:ADP ribosyltransferase domain-containing protein n=1 Tax=Adineta steineri TaxID=433720 RepID=A0A818SA26_9BILA|nr:unnamed protein product [Adineta steineri]